MKYNNELIEEIKQNYKNINTVINYTEEIPKQVVTRKQVVQSGLIFYFLICVIIGLIASLFGVNINYIIIIYLVSAIPYAIYLNKMGKKLEIQNKQVVETEPKELDGGVIYKLANLEIVTKFGYNVYIYDEFLNEEMLESYLKKIDEMELDFEEIEIVISDELSLHSINNLVYKKNEILNTMDLKPNFLLSTRLVSLLILKDDVVYFQ